MASSVFTKMKRRFSKKDRDRRKSNSEIPEDNALKQEEPRPGCSTAQEAKPSGKEGKHDTENGPSTSGNHACEGGCSRNEEAKEAKGISMDNGSALERTDYKEDSKNESSLNASSRSSLSSAENTKRGESICELSFENIACENESLDESLESKDVKSLSDQGYAEANNLNSEDNELVMQLQEVKVINATKNKTDGQQLNQLGREAAIFEDPNTDVMNSAQPQNPDVVEGTREAEEHSLQVHVQEQAQLKAELLVSEMLSKKEIENRICLKLDQGSLVISNWESLACELKAPEKIKAACRRATAKSPTELLFESLESWSHTANLTVNTLIQLLREMKRNDAVEVITNAIPAQDRENKVSDKITNNQELLQELAAKLDKESRVLKSWKHLGLKLEVKKEILQEIGNGNCPNAVEALFEYIYSTMPGLTVEEFMEKMVKIQRIDVMDLFTDIKTGKMVEVAPLHSDLMCSICYMLNKSSTALKNWRHLASELGIDYDTYKSFEPEPPQSPTSILLEWAHIEKGDTYTVRDFCKSLEKIKRYDAIELLEKEFGQKFRQSR